MGTKETLEKVKRKIKARNVLRKKLASFASEICEANLLDHESSEHYVENLDPFIFALTLYEFAANMLGDVVDAELSEDKKLEVFEMTVGLLGECFGLNAVAQRVDSDETSFLDPDLKVMLDAIFSGETKH
jgi:hypothetical protein